MNTNLKAFLVGMLAVVLAMGPWVGSAVADGQSNTNIEKVAQDLSALDLQYNLVQQLSNAVQEWVGLIENELRLGDPTSSSLAFIGSGMNEAWQQLFDREREHGEFGFVVSAAVQANIALTTTSKQSEQIEITKILTTAHYDFDDQGVVNAVHGTVLQWAPEYFRAVERAICVITGPAGSVQVDCVLLTHNTGAAGAAVTTIIPLSAATENGAPSTVAITSHGDPWGCAVYGLVWAAVTSACAGLMASCIMANPAACLGARRVCCMFPTVTMNMSAICLEFPLPAWADGIGDIITLACAFLP